MNYEIKSAQTASVREIYYDKNLNKMVFKNDLGIITPLDNTSIPGPQGPQGPTGATGATDKWEITINGTRYYIPIEPV